MDGITILIVSIISKDIQNPDLFSALIFHAIKIVYY